MARVNCLVRRVTLTALMARLTLAASAQLPPTILVQPFNQSACFSGNATFSVTAGSEHPITFQWRRDGTNVFDGVVSTATNSSLTINNLLPPDAASVFDVIASNFVGSTTSVTAQVFFNNPAIFVQPQGITAHAGDSFSLGVSPCGTGPLFFQWFFNDAPLVNGGRISGATSQMLGITNAKVADSGTYQVVIHNSHGAVHSQPVQCNVVSAPAIVADLKPQGTCVGADVQFQVTATGTPPLYFEWHRDGTNAEAQVISSATNSILIVTNIQLFDAFSVFDVAITNDYGTTNSILVGVFFPDPAIKQHPTNTVVGPGEEISLAAEACGTLPLAYQWYKDALAVTNNLRISGAQSNFLSINPAATNDTGDYHLVVSDQFGFNFATSAVARCFVGWPPTVGSLTSRVVRFRATHTFNPVYTGTPPLTYQWYRNDVAIPGAVFPALTQFNVQRPQVGQYHVVVSNGAGTATSEKAHVQVRLSLQGTSVVYYEEATDELPSLTNAVPSLFTPPPTTLFHGVPLLFTTYGATAQPWEAVRCDVAPSHTMWVRYHARLVEPTRVTTEGSSFNTVVAVYTWTKSTNDAPAFVQCDDNSGYDGQTSRLFFTPAAFTDYYIAVDGVNGATGIVRLQVGESIRNAAYNQANDSFRFEFSGFFVSNNVLRTVGSLTPPVGWSNLITVPPTNTDWVRGYTNIPASASPQRFYKVQTTP